MREVKRRERAAAIAVIFSVVAHVLVLSYLALQAPKLRLPREEAGPPEPIIPVLIMPRAPPAAPGVSKPTPIRLHRRQLRPTVELPPVPPLVTPMEPAKAAPTPPPAPKQLPSGGSSVQPSPSAQLSAALRSGAVGCANPELLSPSERARCEERLGRGAASAPFPGLGLDAAKQQALDAAAQHNAACQNYRNGGAFPGLRNGPC